MKIFNNYSGIDMNELDRYYGERFFFVVASKFTLNQNV